MAVQAQTSVVKETATSVSVITKDLKEIVTYLSKSEIEIEKARQAGQRLFALGQVEVSRRSTRAATEDENRKQNEIKLNISNTLLEQKRWENEKVKWSAALAKLKEIVGPIHWPYIYPSIDIPLNLPHARYVAKYIPLSVALQELLRNKSSDESTLVDQINRAETEESELIRSITAYEELLEESNDPQEASLNARVLSYKTVLQRTRFRLEAAKNTFSYLTRQLLQPRMPPLSQVSRMCVWCLKDNATYDSLYKTIIDVDEVPDLIDFWYRFTVVTNFGRWVQAIVIQPRLSSDYPYWETIYPSQASIFSIINEPFNSWVFERAAKRLPQENLHPSVWDVLTRSSEPKSSEKKLFVTVTNQPAPYYILKVNLIPTSMTYITRASLPAQSLDQIVIQASSPETNEVLHEVSWAWLEMLLKQATMITSSDPGFISLFNEKGSWMKFDLRAPSWDLLKLARSPLQSSEKDNEIDLWNALPKGLSKLPVLTLSKIYIATLWLTVPAVVPPIWLSEKTYMEKETVMFHGDTFIAIANNTGVTPSSTESKVWKPLILKEDQYTHLPIVVQVQNGFGIHFVMIRPVYSASSRYPCLYWSADKQSNQPNNRPKEFTSELTRPYWKSLLEGGSTAPPNSSLSKWWSHAHFVSAEGGCGQLTSGGAIVNTHKLLSDLFNVDFMQLEDLAKASGCSVGRQEIALKVTTSIKEGLPWYSRFGFIPTEDYAGIRFVHDYLAIRPFSELRAILDSMFKRDESEQRASITEGLSCGAGCTATQCKMTLRQMVGNAITNTCTTLALFLDIFGRLSDLNNFLKSAKQYYFNEYMTSKSMVTEESVLLKILETWKKKDAVIAEYMKESTRISHFFDSDITKMLWIRRPLILKQDINTKTNNTQLVLKIDVNAKNGGDGSFLKQDIHAKNVLSQTFSSSTDGTVLRTKPQIVIPPQRRPHMPFRVRFIK